MKKLLILGAGSLELDIIRSAKKMGIYTIVTDSNVDWKLSPAKYEANEAWDISWSDISLLEDKCIQNSIDGCISGYSEIRAIYTQQLCERLHKPIYSIGADLDIIYDKQKFKQACVECGVAVPKSYKIDEIIDFPVIVKPVDCGGSKGISICYNDDELSIAYSKALEVSPSKQVIIEEYLTSDEIIVYFTVVNGIVFLSAMCDRNMFRYDKNITQLPNGYFYPSIHLDIFQKYNFEKFEKLIKHLNIKNGLIAFQSFVKGNDVIPFDPTYRLDGSMSYHITSQISGTHVLEMLINYSLSGNMGDGDLIKSKENPYFKKFGFQLPILLGKGIIKSIEGLEYIKNLNDVIYVYQGHYIGEEMTKIADFTQILFRINIVSNTIDNLILTVNKIYENLRVVNMEDQDMIICRFDPNLLISKYSK